MISNTLSLTNIADYVNCPMKFKYGTDEDIRPVEIRECYAEAIKEVILKYVSSIITKGGTYTWQKMLRRWIITWTRNKDRFTDAEFNRYLLIGHTACRYFFDLDTEKSAFVGFEVPFELPMGSLSIKDNIDLIRVVNQHDKSKRRVQLISLFPGYLGWSTRDKSLSIVMTTYRAVLKDIEKMFGKSIIQGYDFIWFDAHNSLFHDCNHEDVPEELYYSCISYISTIGKAISNDIFYPRFDESSCGRCCFKDSCSMEHAVPSESAREIYNLMRKRKND